MVGIIATGRGELVFDTSRSSRKYRNLSAFAQVALVIGWDNDMTVQCEGTADIPTGADRDRCLQAYFAQYPDGVDRAHDPDIVHVRVRPSWLRYSDYRPESLPSRRPLWGIDSCARDRSSFQNSPVRYAIALGQGGWVVRNGITGRFVTQPGNLRGGAAE